MSKAVITSEQYARSKLLSFVRLMYPKYIVGRMHEVIALYLEALEKGTIRRLLIFSPPRHGKTLLASELFPAWFIGRNPEWQIIWSTYNQKRGDDVGRKVRNLVDSDLHRSIFPNCTIAQDSKSISHFSTMEGGEYYNVSVGGGVTGRGANCLPAETMINVEIDSVIKTIAIVTLVKLLSSKEIRILSLDHTNNTLVYKKVIAARGKTTNELYEITTDSGYSIRATGDHKFFIQGQGYIKAKNIQKGDTLTTATNRGIPTQVKKDTVSMVKRIGTKEIPVYDIQVEETGNFFAYAVCADNKEDNNTHSILISNCFIIDDPTKSRKEIESQANRKDLQEWYRAVAYTRLMPDNRVVIINTRWHDDDLSGYVLKNHLEEDWVVLDLKALAEENDPLGRKEGEALWPEYYSKKKLESIKKIVGSYEWNSQFQQHPVSREGGIVKHDWLKHYKPKEIPEFQRMVISWDTAFKDSEISDPTAATVWGISENGYYLLDVLNKRMEFTELKRRCIQLYTIHNAQAVLIEDRASGQSLIQEMKMSSRMPIIPMSTDNVNKVIRFDAVAPLFEAGKVFLPEDAHWLAEYEYQITNFPSTEHDDMVDSTSQFLKWVNKPRYVRRSPEKLYWK